jgi:signal transduction histidine kinase
MSVRALTFIARRRPSLISFQAVVRPMPAQAVKSAIDIAPPRRGLFPIIGISGSRKLPARFAGLRYRKLNMRHQAQGLGGSAANLQRSVANAMRGAQRAATLTQRLLAFSRRHPLDPKLLDLNKYLPGVGEFLQRSLGETIELEVIGAPRLWPIQVDVPQLETSLVNVAVNARHAMPNGGKLTVEASNQTLDRDYRRTNPEVTPASMRSSVSATPATV